MSLKPWQLAALLFIVCVMLSIGVVLLVHN